MSLLTESIRQDLEYKQLLKTLEQDFRHKPLPILASGLCDGASDAFLVSLLGDTVGFRGGTALLIFPEEKDCVRACGMLEHYGIRAAFYMARDLTFYNITASHEYEHERLRVLSGLLGGDYDVVVTTPDAALGYTVPPATLSGNLLFLTDTDTVDLTRTVKRLTDAGNLL